MGTLQGFIDELVVEFKTIEDIKYTPTDPPARLVTWPATPVWAVTGASRADFGQTVTYTHDVRVGILGPSDDMTNLSRVLCGLLEPIVENIYGKYVNSLFTDIDAMGLISYTSWPIDWRGAVYFGFMLTIHDVVISNTTK